MLKNIIAFALFSTTAFGQVGMASWYGAENSKSSTGKKLIRNKPAAAHRTLPFGTKIKVTSIRSKKSVVAVVDDRGPYTRNRIIDLNRIAAVKLGMIKDGVTKVKIEVVK